MKEKHIIVDEDQHEKVKAISKDKGMTIKGLIAHWIKSEK